VGGRVVMVEKPVVVLPIVWTFATNALLRSHKHHGQFAYDLQG
jgi:hypothetical protein